MNASLPLGKTFPRFLAIAAAILFLAGCNEEDAVGGDFKDNVPQPGDAQLVSSVDEVEIAVMESFPLQLHITARGMTRTGGWTDAQLVLDEEASKGIRLVYRFMAVRPTGMATQAFTPIEASVSYGPWTDRAAREIEIIAGTNSETLMFPGPAQE